MTCEVQFLDNPGAASSSSSERVARVSEEGCFSSIEPAAAKTESVETLRGGVARMESWEEVKPREPPKGRIEANGVG